MYLYNVFYFIILYIVYIILYIVFLKLNINKNIIISRVRLRVLNKYYYVNIEKNINNTLFPIIYLIF